MKKILTLQKNFLRKNIKSILSFSIILLISTILFNSVLVVKNNIDNSYNKKFDELNTANTFFIISSSEYDEELLNEISDLGDIKQVEANNGIMLTIPVMMEDAYQEQNIIFYNVDDIRKISKYNIIKENNNVDSGIYLSNYTYIHSGLDINDKFEFDIDNTSYSYDISGVIEEMQYGNYSSSIISEYLSYDLYNDLLNNYNDKQIVTLNIICNDSYKSYKEISKYLSNKNINILYKNYDIQSKNQRLAIANILVLIITMFSALILIVSLLVSKFKISESIDDEITNMGVLKALGYTSNEIMFSIIMPYLILGLLSSILGIILSYFVIPLLATVIEMQSGFIWKPNIDMLSNLITLLINMILITIFTLISAIKIKKLNVVTAIRGIDSNSSDKIYFEIDKTKGNIEFNLMLKNFMNSIKQNILLGIVLLFVTLISSFVGILFYNVNLNPINFVNTLVEEHPSVVVQTNSDIKSEIKDMDNVKDIIYYDEFETITYNSDSYKVFVSESFASLANDLCYEGVNPSNIDEIAVGSSIKEKYNLKIGDYIDIKKNDIIKSYKVVGFVQSVNYSGEIFELTLDGYKELNNDYESHTLYIYLEDENKSSEFIDALKQEYKDYIISTMDYAESMNSAITMYVSLVSIICIIIIIIAIILIYLILYILISSIIMKRKQELGIFKALGYKNKQLVFNVVSSFIPSTLISTILGIIISKIYIKNIYETIFKSVGAYKVSFNYPVILFLLIGIVIMLSTILIGSILSKKIKRISVYSLIRD